MKRLTTLTLLSLISSQTFAYELVNFSSSRVRTTDEILTETNKTYADLGVDISLSQELHSS